MLVHETFASENGEKTEPNEIIIILLLLLCVARGQQVGPSEALKVVCVLRGVCVCVRARSVCVECVSVAQRPFERRIVCACVPLVSSSLSC